MSEVIQVSRAVTGRNGLRLPETEGRCQGMAFRSAYWPHPVSFTITRPIVFFQTAVQSCISSLSGKDGALIILLDWKNWRTDSGS